MPELPEAENIVRTLIPHIGGGEIAGVEFFTERARLGPIPELAGRRIVAVRRYGKRVHFELNEGHLVVELRMTGLLLWREGTGRHTRVRIRFHDGAVCFDDIRQFGSIRYRETAPMDLGPDALEVSAKQLRELLAPRRRMIKPLLLDQHFLRGLGNIYVDEILFRARINPVALASRMSRNRVGRLHDAIELTLTEAIELGGSSISDYLNADGVKGRFQLRHQVYGKQGQACPRCRVAIRRIVVGGRGTHFCPNCQRR